jgi:DHA3 family macrolide efflux protein-like MFS transporter
MKTIISKDYTKLLTATFITRFGDSIDSIAFSWMVYVMTGSRVLMGTIFAISIIPNILVLPFGGVVADVFNKKVITVLGDILRGVSVAILAIFYLLNILEVWHLFVFVSINSLFESFANPARGSMLPNIIEKEDYVKGTSWIGTASNFGSLIGLSVAGILIAVVGIWATILIDAFTFLFSGLLISLIKFKDRREAVAEKPKIKDYFVLIGEGISYLKTKRILISLLLLAAFLNFALVPLNVLRPVYVAEVLNLGVEGLSYLGMAVMIGMVVGGYIIGAKGKNINTITGIGVGLLLLGFTYMLMGIPGYTNFSSNTNLMFVIVISFFFGFSVPLVNAPMQAAIMKTTAPEMLGRLSSIMGVVALCAMPLGGVVVSLIGDSISVSLLFIVMGLSGVLLSSIFWISNRNKQLV